MNFLLPGLYILGLYCAYAAGSIFLRARSIQPLHSSKTSAFHLPRATLLLVLVVAVPTTLQFFFPAILSLFQRDYARFLGGDWWRLLTPLFVQDGGVAGAIFNLISLLLVGSVAEQLWDSRQVLGIFFIGGIVGEIAGLAWQPIGAGNSVGNFSLAASVAVACLRQRPGRGVQIAGLLALGADLVLLVLKDIHGAAGITGAAVALVLRGGWQNEDQQLEQ
jgi:membrane associated rhomboid family serine protease